MPITASTLYYNTLNFFRNQCVNIVILTLLTSLISVVLSYVLLPGDMQLITLNDITQMHNASNMHLKQLAQQMSVEQKWALLKISATNTLAGLIGNVLLVGGLLAMIRQVSNRQPVSVLRAINLSIPLLPRLFLLIFFTTLLVQLGLALIILPGLLVAIAFSLAPVIIASDNLGIIKSIYLSTSLTFSNFRLLAPAVFFWLMTKIAVLLLVIQFNLTLSLTSVVLLNGLNNLISALLLIYLYRLYMLLRET